MIFYKTTNILFILKIQIKILLVVLLSLFLCAPQLSAQIVDEHGQYIDTTFNNNVDRTAEDFVIAFCIFRIIKIK